MIDYVKRESSWEPSDVVFYEGWRAKQHPGLNSVEYFLGVGCLKTSCIDVDQSH
jgi:hypothetical protein